MGRSFAYLAVVLLAGVFYVLSPFWAAWQLREAIKSGDTETIQRKVHWQSVRSSLKASIQSHRDLMPEATRLGEQIQPSMWQRVKAAFGATMVDRFVETYITPDGLAKLAAYRKTWRERVRGMVDESALPWRQRLARFYARLRRAEFTGLTRALIEVADKDVPTRSYVGVFELNAFEWRLISLRVRSLVPMKQFGGA